jgi:predicted NBD/HSP70 family sugar kinase
MHGLVFDLGGTFLRAGVAGQDGVVRYRSKARICSVAHNLDPCEIWNRILNSMLDYVVGHEDCLAVDSPVVISFPGPIGKNQEIIQAPTVAGSGSSVFDLPRMLASRTGRHVTVLNDVSAAAWRIAQQTTVRRFAVVTVSSGIGSKIFDRCHASGVLDQPPYAGEIGHVVVDDSPDAPICDCGGKGHLGAVASARGMERIIRQRAQIESKAFCKSLLVKQFGATLLDLTNETHIVPAIKSGDAWTSKIVSDCTRHLIRSLLTVSMACGLEKIFFIGGFVSELGDRYFEIVHPLVRDLSRYEVAGPYLDDLFEVVHTDQETCL